VRLIDARAVGAGATQASAGVLAPYIEGHERGPLLDLTVRSLSMYDRFVSDVRGESGLEVEFRRCGTLEVAVDEACAVRQRAAQEQYARAGVDLHWLAPDALRDVEPGLADTVAGALLVRPHAYVAVGQLTEALSWAAMRHGAEIETAHRVTTLRRTGSRLEVLTSDRTSWTADAVVIAAGSWSGELGLREPAARAVRPVRGQLLRLSWHGRPLQHILWGPDCYVVPWLDGTVLVGATMEEVGFDERTTAAGVRDLLDAVCELVPEAWGAGFVEARVGLRPATRDGFPIIGRSAEIDGLYYATGHFRNGILLAPLTAKLVADLVLDRISDRALEVTTPARIRS
jgi:glycine oxidase